MATTLETLTQQLKDEGAKVRETSRKAVRGIRGFTLAEMLTVVGIILVMTAIGFVGVIQLRDSMRHLRMDDTAREIYIVGQDQMARGVERNNLQDKIDAAVEAHNSAYLGTQIPKSAGSSIFPDNDGQYYYITHTGGAVPSGSILDDILPLNSIDEGVRQGQYVIVYNAQTATIFEVFFTSGTLGTLPDWDTLNDENLRDRDTRHNYTSCFVGYYGGTSVNFQDVDLSALSLTINNGNRLTATINYPDLGVLKSGQIAVFSLVVTGQTSGASRTLAVARQASTNSELTLDSSLSSGFMAEVLTTESIGSTTLRRAGLVLDDVTSSDSHFVQLFGTASKNDNNTAFIPGENLDIYATMTVAGAPAAGQESNHFIVNSLFGSVEEGEVEEGQIGPRLDVSVANFRHLENLDNAISGFVAKNVLPTVKNLTVTQSTDLVWEVLATAQTHPFSTSADISGKEAQTSAIFADDVTTGIITDKDGNELIGSRAYYGVKIDGDPSIFSFDGAGNNIINAWMSAPEDTSVGLFRESVVATLDLSNIHLLTPTLQAQGGSSYAGALVGEVRASSSFTLSNCWVKTDELDELRRDAIDTGTVVGAQVAGGLIGRSAVASGRITDSFTALRKVSAGSIAGGFIGEVNGSAGTLQVIGCYAAGRTKNTTYDEDNFNVETTNNATDTSTGGFVGRVSERQSSGDGLELEYCYATTSAKGANGAPAGGFVGSLNNGVVKVDYCYSTGLVFSSTGGSTATANRYRHPFVGTSYENSAIVKNSGSFNYYLSRINSSLEPETVYVVEQGIDKTSNVGKAEPYDDDLEEYNPYLSCAELGRDADTALTMHVGDWPEVPESSTLKIVNTNRLSIVIFAPDPSVAVIRLFNTEDPAQATATVTKSVPNTMYRAPQWNGDTEVDGWVDSGVDGPNRYYYEWILDDPTIAGKNWASQFGSQLTPGGNYYAMALVGLSTWNAEEAKKYASSQFSSLFADNNTVDSVEGMTSVALDESVAYIAYARHLQNLNADISGLNKQIDTITQLRTLTWGTSVSSNVVGETPGDTVFVRSGSYYDENSPNGIAGLSTVWKNTQQMSTTTMYAYSTNEPLRDSNYGSSDGYFLSIPSTTATLYAASNGSWAIRNFRGAHLRPAIFDTVNHSFEVRSIDIQGAAINEGVWETANKQNFAAIFIARATGGTVRFTNIDMTDVVVNGIRTTGALVAKAQASVEINDVHLTQSSPGKSSIYGNQGWAGGFVGDIERGKLTVTNSSVTLNTVLSGNTDESQDAGGIVGRATAGASFTGCEVNASSIESPHANAGGLGGIVSGGATSISACSVRIGDIKSGSNDTSHAGGFAGRTEGGLSVLDNSTINVTNVNSPGGSAGGIVGQAVYAASTIKKATVNITNVTGANHTGGLLGLAENGVTLEDTDIVCSYINSAGQRAGGAIGDLSSGGLSAKRITVSVPNGVSGTYETAGLVGRTVGASTVENVTYSGGDISASSSSAGGIVGQSSDGVLKVTDCTATVANVTGSSWQGCAAGVVGLAQGGATLTNCAYSGTAVTGRLAGGLIGSVEGSLLTVRGCSVSASTIKAIQEDAGGYVGSALKGADISDARVLNMTITGKHAGGVIGETTGASLKIASSSTQNITIIATASAGGIAGYSNQAALFTNSYAYDCTVMGSNHAGGLAGIVGEGTKGLTIENCFAAGTVRADQWAGGLVGWAGMTSGNTIRNSYVGGRTNSGRYGQGTFYCETWNNNKIIYTDASSFAECYNVIGKGGAGGFIGHIETNGAVSISNSYSTASAWSDWQPTGGFIGSINQNTVSCTDKCYATGLVGGGNNNNHSAFVGGGVGLASGSSAFYISEVNNGSTAFNTLADSNGATADDGTQIAGPGTGIPFDATLSGSYPYRTVTSVGPDATPATSGNRHFGDWYVIP